jgi:hypothetical protein
MHMLRSATALAIVIASSSGAMSPAMAQVMSQVAPLTTTPGPGGVPIAPGPPVRGYTPGGVGMGGGEIAPGPAARSVPMYREAPGGVPVLVLPPRDGTDTRRHGGVAGGGPCTGAGCPPDGLRFTVAANQGAAMPDRVDSLSSLRAALRACWTPPESDFDMSVRFSFRRSGDLMGPPRVTYTGRGADAETRRDLERSITAAFAHCIPFRLSPEFAAGTAGRPFSVRFVGGRRGR